MSLTEDLDQQAGRFLIEQDNPAFTDEQCAELCRWISQSPAHCTAYVKMVREWRWQVVFYEGGYGDAVDRRIGGMLRACREERRLSVEEVVRRVDLSAEEIQELESGKRELTFAAVIVLAPALRIAPSRLAMKLEQAIAGPSQRQTFTQSSR